MAEPRASARRMEQEMKLPGGDAERFSGYAVLALPFASGHILTLRRWPATSIGPGYTSVWHRSPESRWTFYTDVPAEQSCPRYFSNALSGSVEGPIEVEWEDDRHLTISIGGDVDLDWQMTLTPSLMTRGFEFRRYAAARAVMAPAMVPLDHGLHGRRCPGGRTYPP